MGSGNRRSPATGRKMREAVNKPGYQGGGPQRSNGKIVRKGKLEHQRARAEGGREGGSKR
jgi:hypothetical protein